MCILISYCIHQATASLKHKAKEELITHHTLFKSFVTTDPKAVEALEERFKKSSNRTKTSKYEVLLVKAIISTTKTNEQKNDAIKEAFAEHSKQTRQIPDDWFFKPLLTEANRLMTSQTLAAKAAAPVKAAAPAKAAAPEKAAKKKTRTKT
jgi:hypothetical protein